MIPFVGCLAKIGISNQKQGKDIPFFHSKKLHLTQESAYERIAGKLDVITPAVVRLDHQLRARLENKLIWIISGPDTSFAALSAISWQPFQLSKIKMRNLTDRQLAMLIVSPPDTSDR